MRSTAVSVQMRATLPRARACTHGIFVSRRWRGSAPLNVGLLNAFGVLEGVAGGVRFHDEFHDEFHGGHREAACGERTSLTRSSAKAFKCQRPQQARDEVAMRHTRGRAARIRTVTTMLRMRRLHNRGHDLRGRCARACCARWPRRPERKTDRAAITPGRCARSHIDAPSLRAPCPASCLSPALFTPLTWRSPAQQVTALRRDDSTAQPLQARARAFQAYSIPLLSMRKVPRRTSASHARARSSGDLTCATRSLRRNPRPPAQSP